MYIVRLSLFCIAALLVNGAYATDFIGSAGATAKTAELTLSNAPQWETRVGVWQDGSTELRRQRVRGVGEDANWLRISNGVDNNASAEPRPANTTPRWVF